MKLGNIVKQSIDIDSNKNLKTLSNKQLKGLKSVLLSMLTEIDDICRKNDLKYILIGGTAIGALRNSGFISWDDDIDIAMPRSDFDKFAKIININLSKKYSILNPREKNNFGRIIPKLRLRNTAYRTILEYDLRDCGIFIDIYLIENAYNSFIARLLQGTTDLTFGFLLSCRRIFFGKSHYKPFYKGFSKDAISFKVRLFIGFLISFASLNKWAKWTDHWYSVCKNNQTKFVSIPSDDYHFFGELYKRNELCQIRNIKFENSYFYVSKNVESYLKKRYGDFMIEPPIDKQERNRYLEFDLGRYENEK